MSIYNSRIRTGAIARKVWTRESEEWGERSASQSSQEEKREQAEQRRKSTRSRHPVDRWQSVPFHTKRCGEIRAPKDKQAPAVSKKQKTRKHPKPTNYWAPLGSTDIQRRRARAKTRARKMGRPKPKYVHVQADGSGSESQENLGDETWMQGSAQSKIEKWAQAVATAQGDMHQEVPLGQQIKETQEWVNLVQRARETGIPNALKQANAFDLQSCQGMHGPTRPRSASRKKRRRRARRHTTRVPQEPEPQEIKNGGRERRKPPPTRRTRPDEQAPEADNDSESTGNSSDVSNTVPWDTWATAPMMKHLQPFRDEILASPVLSHLWVAYTATIPLLSWQSVSSAHALEFVKHVRALTDRMHTTLSQETEYWSPSDAWLHTWRTGVGVQHTIGVSPCALTEITDSEGMGLQGGRPFGCKRLHREDPGPTLWAVQPHHTWQEFVTRDSQSQRTWVLGVPDDRTVWIEALTEHCMQGKAYMAYTARKPGARKMKLHVSGDRMVCLPGHTKPEVKIH